MIPTSELERTIKDLLWAINSPSLLANADELTAIDRSAFNHDQLTTTVAANPNRRVGKYFEQLIRFWLQSIRSVSELEHSRQIREGKRTIGELDFLFTDERNCRTHLETAVKFYLFEPDLDVGGSHLIGPNAADTFQRKMKRLLNHQLPLGRKHIAGIARTTAIVKGRIFYHPDKAIPVDLPAELSRDHVRGIWIYQRETEYFLDQPSPARYRVMQKPHWLSSDSVPLNDDSLLTANGLVDHLRRDPQKCSRPVLVSQLGENKTHYDETNRIFVVADSWPNATESSQDEASNQG